MAEDAAKRKKEYYTKQRVTAEERADEGDSSARKTVSKIYSKLGRPDRDYTDPSAVDDMALGAVGGPEDIAGLGAAWGAKKLAGMAAKKVGGMVGKALSKGGSKAATATKDVEKTRAVSKGPKKVLKSEKGEQLKRDNENYLPRPKASQAGKKVTSSKKGPSRKGDGEGEYNWSKGDDKSKADIRPPKTQNTFNDAKVEAPKAVAKKSMSKKPPKMSLTAKNKMPKKSAKAEPKEDMPKPSGKSKASMTIKRGDKPGRKVSMAGEKMGKMKKGILTSHNVYKGAKVSKK